MIVLYVYKVVGQKKTANKVFPNLTFSIQRKYWSTKLVYLIISSWVSPTRQIFTESASHLSPWMIQRFGLQMGYPFFRCGSCLMKGRLSGSNFQYFSPLKK